MAQLISLPFLRHVRGEANAHLMHLKRGQLVQSGRGISFWFLPFGSNLVEVPLDDREVPLLFHGHSSDHQEVVVQGSVVYRVVRPNVLFERVNFALDTGTGRYKEQPLESLAGGITQLAQQLAINYLARSTLAVLLDVGLDAVRTLVQEGLGKDRGVADLGIEIVATRIARVSATPEVEKALQMPTLEQIQQRADEATFGRRALAVQKESAIAENELKNRIELARKGEELIAQEGQNSRRRATEAAEAKRIEVEAEAQATRMRAEAEAEATVALEKARVDAERARMDIYRTLPGEVLLGLAARELAGSITSIDHLSLSPDAIGPLLERVLKAGATRLEANKA